MMGWEEKSAYEIAMMCGIAALMLLWLVAAARVLFKKLAPVKAVKAQVVEKRRNESFSKYNGTGKTCKYLVVFQTEGKKRGFYVNEFSYNGYQLKETGTLTYKGDRIIDFK